MNAEVTELVFETSISVIGVANVGSNPTFGAKYCQLVKVGNTPVVKTGIIKMNIGSNPILAAKING